MSAQVNIYVRLLDEGTSVYRPVLAQNLGKGLFQIISKNSDDEVWEFETGSIVIGEPQYLSKELKVVAVRLANNKTLT